jgi:hypothetical protein
MEANFQKQSVGRRCCAAGDDGRAATRPYRLECVPISIGNWQDTRLALPPNLSASKRLAREGETMAAMVRCYCRDLHGTGAALCPVCQGLLDYAAVRLDRCRFGAEKPTCANCPVHCYQRDRREQMKAVMRHAGPRMLWRHPVLSLRHWLDGFRKVNSGNRS